VLGVVQNPEVLNNFLSPLVFVKLILTSCIHKTLEGKLSFEVKKEGLGNLRFTLVILLKHFGHNLIMSLYSATNQKGEAEAPPLIGGGFIT